MKKVLSVHIICLLFLTGCGNLGGETSENDDFTITAMELVDAPENVQARIAEEVVEDGIYLLFNTENDRNMYLYIMPHSYLDVKGRIEEDSEMGATFILSCEEKSSVENEMSLYEIVISNDVEIEAIQLEKNGEISYFDNIISY